MNKHYFIAKVVAHVSDFSKTLAEARISIGTAVGVDPRTVFLRHARVGKQVPVRQGSWLAFGFKHKAETGSEALLNALATGTFLLLGHVQPMEYSGRGHAKAGKLEVFVYSAQYVERDNTQARESLKAEQRANAEANLVHQEPTLKAKVNLLRKEVRALKGERDTLEKRLVVLKKAANQHRAKLGISKEEWMSLISVELREVVNA